MPQEIEGQRDASSAAGPESMPEAGGVLAGKGGDGAPPQQQAEIELWSGHTSWKHYADLVGLAAGWTVVALLLGFNVPSWLAWMLFIFTLLGWGYAAGRILYAMCSRRYRLTTQRLFIERGIISRTIDQTELIRVDDVRIHKQLLDRMLGLGTVQILSTDSSDRDICIVGIAQPERLADAVREHMRLLRTKSLFIENL